MNLLNDPLIRVQDAEQGFTACSLPEILASLSSEGKGTIVSFLALQPHQWPAWYTFLVQIGALAIREDRGDSLLLDEQQWRSRLKRLTSRWANDEPWSLVVKDLSIPALMQPPVPEMKLEGFKGPHATPDAPALDILVTTRHHDVKAGRLVGGAPDSWIFCLVTLQTQAGFDGRNHYGVIRMNGGMGSRPVVGIAPSQNWRDRFRRDLLVLHRHHDEVAEEKGLPRSEGKALLWTEPWDGKTPIAFKDCDPYCIEVARRIRLVQAPQGIRAYTAGSEKPRLSPKSDVLKGNVGDPWIPVGAAGSALTLSGRGLTYDRIRQLLLGDEFRRSLCQRPQPDDPEAVFFYAASLSRGQGKTEGFHQRWIPIPKEKRYFLFDDGGRQALNELARDRVTRAGDVRRKALHPALLTLLEGAPRKLDLRHKQDQRWLDEFEAGVDRDFFPMLWADADRPEQEQKRSWAEALHALAEAALLTAEKEAPLSDARRERSIAHAWVMLRSRLRKQIPDAFEQTKEVTEDAADRSTE